VVEGAPLLRAYGSKAHRGFESLPLRHTARKILDVIVQITVAATKRGFEPEICKRGFDKIAFGDFGRCSAAATVRSEAEDERRSREQSLPLRQQKIPVKIGSCGRMGSVERTGCFLLPAYCQPTASYVGILLRIRPVAHGLGGSLGNWRFGRHTHL
jgi:hypothetical protein